MDNSNKINTILFKISTIVFVFIYLYIFISGLFLKDGVLYKFNPVITVICVVVYTFLSIIIFNKLLLKIKKDKSYNTYSIIIICTMICLQLIAAYFLRVNPSWDMGAVISLSTDIQINGSSADFTYTDAHPNNLPIAVLFAIIFKVSSYLKLGISNQSIALIFNVFMITLSIISLYLVVKKKSGNKKAFMCLLISFFTLAFYTYGPIYYTDTLTLFVPTLLLYLYFLIEDSNNKKQKNIIQIILGIVLFIGFKLKLTSIFIFIAILLYNIFKYGFKKTAKTFIIPIVLLVILNVIYVGILKNNNMINVNRTEIHKIPTQHWVMMGLSGNGGFNGEDCQFTDKYLNYKEKKIAINEEITKRLKAYTFISFVDHLNKKMIFTWDDGTYFSPEKLTRQIINSNELHEYVLQSGNKNQYFNYFTQAAHLSLMFFMCIAALALFIKKDYFNRNIIIIISLLGTVMFLLIWETRSRYILNIIPLMIILEVEGIEYICNKINSLKEIISINMRIKK